MSKVNLNKDQKKLLSVLSSYDLLTYNLSLLETLLPMLRTKQAQEEMQAASPEETKKITGSIQEIIEVAKAYLQAHQKMEGLVSAREIEISKEIITQVRDWLQKIHELLLVQTEAAKTESFDAYARIKVILDEYEKVTISELEKLFLQDVKPKVRRELLEEVPADLADKLNSARKELADTINQSKNPLAHVKEKASQAKTYSEYLFFAFLQKHEK